MQFIHLTEEYVADFPDDFSALTGSHISPNAFVLIAILAWGIAYLFAGFGLIHRHPVANYLLWFFLIGPVGLVNTIAHFTFPFLAGTAYFPGLLTVLLPTTFGGGLPGWSELTEACIHDRMEGHRHHIVQGATHDSLIDDREQSHITVDAIRQVLDQAGGVSRSNTQTY